MSETRLTGILTSIIFIGLIVGGLSLFLVGTSEVYSGDTSDLEEGLVSDFLAESQATSTRLNTARQDLETVEEDRNVLDRLASFFRSGYTSARALFDSLTSVTRLTNSALGELPFLGAFKGQLIVAFGLMITVVFIGIFMHFLIKSERV
jgi:hypothetical protein